MLTFPLFQIPGVNGSCVIHNHSPNNWEIKNGKYSYYSIFEACKDYWTLLECNEISTQESISVKFKAEGSKNHEAIVSHYPLKIVMLSKQKPQSKYQDFPRNPDVINKWPEWRSTIGLFNKKTASFYQGEISPFPPNGNLLSVHPFIQPKPNNNFFIFVNFERSAKARYANLNIVSSLTKNVIYNCTVLNNSCNVINLNFLEIKQKDLPMFCCKTMTGIPFGFTTNAECNQFSFEHTHPPGSIVLGANRFHFQKKIKQKWLI